MLLLLQNFCFALYDGPDCRKQGLKKLVELFANLFLSNLSDRTVTIEVNSPAISFLQEVSLIRARKHLRDWESLQWLPPMHLLPFHILRLVSYWYKYYKMPWYCRWMPYRQWRLKYRFHWNQMDAEAMVAHGLETIDLEPCESEITNGGVGNFSTKSFCSHEFIGLY